MVVGVFVSSSTGTHVSISAAHLRSICIDRAASTISATRLAVARSNLRAAWYALLVSSSAKSSDFSSSTLASHSLAVLVSRMRSWEMDFPIFIARSSSAALCQRWCLRTIAVHEMFDVCQVGSTTQT